MSDFNYVFPKDIYGRDAIKLVQKLSSLDENILFENIRENRSCNAKSLLGVLSLGIKKDDNIKISIDSNSGENIFNLIVDIINTD